MTINFIKFLVIACFSFLVLAQAASAQKIMGQFKKELPKYEFMPEKDFKEKTALYDTVPFEDKELSYSIRLPKIWKESENLSLNTYKVSDKILGEIVRYYSEPRLGDRSRFAIQVLQLDYEISALHWFMNHVITNAITLEGIKEYNKSKVEALYVTIEEDVSYAVRVVAQMTGDRMVLAKYYTPISYWDEERVMQNQVMSSFNLKYPKAVHIEDLKSIQFLDVAEMKYPKSWFLKKPNMRSVDDMSVRLVSLNEINVLNGKIDIAMISTYSQRNLEDQFDWHKKEIEKTGLEIKYLMEKAEDQFTFHPEMDFSFVDVYKAQNKIPYIINYELWIAVMAGQGYFYYVTLLTPSRDEEFFVWSRNLESMKIVVENLGPQDLLLAP